MGLKENEIKKLREKYGFNEITRKKPKTKLEILISILNDPILIIMMVAAVISFISNFESGHFAETYVILSLVIVNVIISFIQDVKTIEQLKSLEKLNEDSVLVIRDDKEVVIPSIELLPGDIVKIKIGIIARADMELIECNSIRVDESFLTGESDEVEKENGQEIYSNSPIKNGVGLAKVVRIGLETKIGQISKDVDRVENIQSQLEKKIHQLTHVLLYTSFIISVIVFILSYLNNNDIAAGLSITISILIATVPEGLATVLTIVLTTMSSKMVKNNALIKKVALLETLGEVSYVCSDKTGTITENKMTVSKNAYYKEDANDIVAFVINSDTPTSKAISDFCDHTNDSGFKLLDSIPFSSTEKKEIQLVSYNNKKYIIVFGGPDFIFSNISELSKEYEEYSSMGLRTLLFAQKEVTYSDLKEFDYNFTSFEILALFGIQDPPKESAITAINQLHEAGVSVVMITGDSPQTAKSIATQSNIIKSDQDLVITGEELNTMSDEELLKNVLKIKVYARTQPEDKVRIVRALQAQKHIVAMTGDGTNDSIALKQANVGVAMGINGTDISKESADLILLDDNFSTIVEALKSGRQIFDNLQKFVRQMLTSNAAHTGSILFTLLFGVFMTKDSALLLPMTPVLILWVNIVSDAIPCLALGIEDPEKDVLQRDPIDPKLPILKKLTIVEILVRGLSLGLLVYIVFTVTLNSGFSEEYARSLGFITLSFGQLIHIFDARSFKTIFLKNPFTNLYLIGAVLLSGVLNLSLIYLPINFVFGLEPVSIIHVIYAILVSSLVTFGFSIIKLLLIKNKTIK